MRQVRWLCVLSVAVAVAYQVVQAQNATAPTAPGAAAQETEPRRGPLPFYFGKVGMSDEQRDQAYDVQEAYDAKIEPLKDEIKKLLAERDTKLTALLTDGQKLRLKELQDEARKKAAAKTEAETKTAPETTTAPPE